MYLGTVAGRGDWSLAAATVLAGLLPGTEPLATEPNGEPLSNQAGPGTKSNCLASQQPTSRPGQALLHLVTSLPVPSSFSFPLKAIVVVVVGSPTSPLLQLQQQLTRRKRQAQLAHINRGQCGGSSRERVFVAASVHAEIHRPRRHKARPPLAAVLLRSAFCPRGVFSELIQPACPEPLGARASLRLGCLNVENRWPASALDEPCSLKHLLVKPLNIPSASPALMAPPLR